MFENDESIWEEFARFFAEEMITLIGGPLVLKAWSKIVAYKCLQGGSVTHDGILTSLGPKGLSEMDAQNKEIFIKCFEQNPVLKEFNTLNQSLQDRRYLGQYMVGEKLKVFPPTNYKLLYLSNNALENTSFLYATDNLCRIASQVVVGGENWVLMLALEAIRRNKIRVIPIIYEYDGFLVLVEIDKSKQCLEQLNTCLQPLLKEANLFEMFFEQK